MSLLLYSNASYGQQPEESFEYIGGIIITLLLQTLQCFPISLGTRPEHATLTLSMALSAICRYPAHQPSWATLPVCTETKPNFQFCDHKKLSFASRPLLFLELPRYSSLTNFTLFTRTPDLQLVTHYQSLPLSVRPPHVCVSMKMNRNFISLFFPIRV